MFNLMSFLIGVAVVFVSGSIVTLISNLLNYDDREAALLYCNCWWLIFVFIIKWLWEHRLIMGVTKEQYERIIRVATKEHPEWTFDPKHIFGNVYSVTWSADKTKYPIRGRLRLIMIVKK
jgi:hypothetical protein